MKILGTALKCKLLAVPTQRQNRLHLMLKG